MPRLTQMPGLSEPIRQWFERQKGVSTVRVNQACASVVVVYDSNLIHSPEEFTDLVWGLAPDALVPKRGNHLAGRDHRATLQGSLSWPTVSLVLCVIKGPAGWAINLPLLVANSLAIWNRALRVLIRERRLNVDFLDSLSIVISILQGKLFTGAFITWLISLGDWIRDQTAAKSKKGIAALLSYQARNAWIIRGKKIVQAPATAVAVGDRLAVYPGEMIPVDGLILQGRASIDQKTITGESLPVERSSGAEVYAGTVVHEGKLVLRALRVGADTTAAQIVHLIEEAPVGETRIQNYAERFADRLVAPTLALSAGMYCLTANLDRLLSMVIIDYGTGIRVAAPTSVLAAMAYAARHGLVIKGGNRMEKLARTDTIVFDKTGTLTRGAPCVREVLSYDKRRFPPRRIIALAASAELRTRHPISDAILAKAREAKVRVPARTGSSFKVGLGIEAQVNGYHVHIGSERFLQSRNIQTDEAVRPIGEWNERGCSTLLLAVDGALTGLITYADEIRPESRAVLQTLRNRGIKNLVMLTGDNEAVARVVAAELGLDQVFSHTLPADKARIVQQLQKNGDVVAMVGDGINDSPALAYADIGIAMKNGADVAHQAADVVLMVDDLWKVITAIDISRDAMALIRQNYGIIAGLNTLAFALALPGGLVTADITALISNGSAILASMNAIRPILKD